MAGNLIIALFAYLLIAIVIAGLFIFPDSREFAARAFARLAVSTASGLRRARTRASSTLGSSLTESRNGSRAALDQFHQHGWAIAIALLILVIPVVAALLLRQSNRLDGFDDRVRSRNAVVSSVLDGEALVPPPPLPPDVFTTREVEQIRPNLGGASRDWAMLDAEFRQRLLNVYKQMTAQGYTMALLEGYRSPQRQAQLASQAQTVTNAGAYQSYHQYGLAADSAFFRDGKLVISEKDPWAMRGYALYGAAAEAEGLRWGGRWDLQDYGHVELKRAGVLGKRP